MMDSALPERGPGNIYWLASYPKSGNTWTRAFIANLTNEKPEPVGINELFTGAIASSREWVTSALDFDIDELTLEEIDRLRPHAYSYLSTQLLKPGYHKTHDAYTLLPSGDPLIPSSATRGALYLVRNPLDVAVSFAHHSGSSIQKSIERMAEADYAFCRSTTTLPNQLRQWLLSWSEHVKSWIESPLHKLVVRYEDMRTRPLETFTRMAEFLELPTDSIRVDAALEQCRIERLQEQEAADAFKEKSAKAERFFRKGIVGDWQQALSSEQVQQIIHDHGEVMREFGYVTAPGMPVTSFG